MLETERLLLRPWRVGDAVVQHELWTERDERVPAHRRLDALGHPTVAELAAQIAAQLEGSIPESSEAAPSRTGMLVVERRAEGDVIGYCGLMASGRGADDAPELAFELLRRFHGQGYATEAARAVVTHARAAGHERLWATVWGWNGPSRRVLAKLGFTETERTEVDPEHGTTLWTVLDL